MGIEPTYPAWKAGALADVLILHWDGGRFLEENLRNSKSFISTCTHNYVLVPATGLEPVRYLSTEGF